MLTPGEGSYVLNEVGDSLVWKSGTESTKVMLEDGKYVLHEDAAPTGYLVANDIEFTLENGKITSIRINGIEQDITDISKIEMIDERIPVSTTSTTTTITTTSITTTTKHPSAVGNEEFEGSGVSGGSGMETTTVLSGGSLATTNSSNGTITTIPGSSPGTGVNGTDTIIAVMVLAFAVAVAVRVRKKEDNE